MPVLPHQDLVRLAEDIYVAAGAPESHAQTVARHQVGANLAGHDSHGLQLLPSYVERIDRGHIAPTATPVVIRETPASTFVDGRWGFGPVVTEWTTRKTIEKARTVGVAVASIRDQSHVGRLAGYPSMAAREGLVAIMMCDSGQGPKQVAPFGGREPRLGTNPLCIALPSDLPGTVCLDMATSAAALAKLKVARARNEPIPSGWLLDKEGYPSTDPNDFFTGGVLLPVGGNEGHKGYGLSVMVETMAALLPGLGFGIDPLGRHNDGLFLVVVDPSIFRPVDEFKAEIEEFMAYLKATPLAAGFEEILYPGELEHRTEVRRRADGVPIEESTWGELAAVGKRFDIDLPRER